MKIKLWTLAFEDRGGIGCMVFTSREKLNEFLERMMLPDTNWQFYENPQGARHVYELVKSGQFDKAWEYWLENVKDEAHTFNIREDEIELPLVERFAEALKAIAADEDACTCAKRGWHGKEHDSQCPVGIALGEVGTT